MPKGFYLFCNLEREIITYDPDKKHVSSYPVIFSKNVPQNNQPVQLPTAYFNLTTAQSQSDSPRFGHYNYNLYTKVVPDCFHYF